MKRLVVILALVFSASLSFGQAAPKGDWYAYITRNYLIKFSLSADSIVSSRLRYDSLESDRYKPVEAFKVAKVVHHRKAFYYIVEKRNGVGGPVNYAIRTFVPQKNGTSYMQVVVKGTDNFEKVEQAEAFIKEDVEAYHGWIMHDIKTIDSYKSLKPLSTVTKDDFLRYLHKLHDMRVEFDSLTLAHTWAQTSNEYLEYQYRDIARTIGYNPLFEGRYLNGAFDKYNKDADVKMLLDSYMQ